MYTATITIQGQNNIVISSMTAIQVHITHELGEETHPTDTTNTDELAKPPTVIEFCKQISDDFKTNGQVNSSNDYKYLANTIAKISPKDITFKEFSKKWLEKIETYLTQNKIRGIRHFRLLKALYNKAIEHKLVDFRENPFKNPHTNPYGFDTAKLRKRKLSQVITSTRTKELEKEELKMLLNYKPQTKAEEKYLDMWLFSYYTFGVNLTDIAHLKRSDIRDGRWYYNRSKTGNSLKSGKPLLPEALAIIEKYDTGNKYIFDILKAPFDKDANSRSKRIHCYAKFITRVTKRISKRLGFLRHFTFYSARYTSATIALNAGADRNTVSHLLDHSHFSTIDHYVGRADTQSVLRAMEVLRV